MYESLTILIKLQKKKMFEGVKLGRLISNAAAGVVQALLTAHMLHPDTLP